MPVKPLVSSVTNCRPVKPRSAPIDSSLAFKCAFREMSLIIRVATSGWTHRYMRRDGCVTNSSVVMENLVKLQPRRLNLRACFE